MGARYSVQRTGTALSTTADYMTLVAPSTRAVKISEIRVVGGAAASAAFEVIVSRATGGTTGGGAITPTPLASQSAAAATVVNTSWGTQPTLGAVVRRIASNANGGINPVIAIPGNEIEMPPGGMLSFRSGLGTSLASLEVVFEEIG